MQQPRLVIIMEEPRLKVRVLNTLQLIKRELADGEDW